jgi:hypothetical protein
MFIAGYGNKPSRKHGHRSADNFKANIESHVPIECKIIPFHDVAADTCGYSSLALIFSR